MKNDLLFVGSREFLEGEAGEGAARIGFGIGLQDRLLPIPGVFFLTLGQSLSFVELVENAVEDQISLSFGPLYVEGFGVVSTSKCQIFICTLVVVSCRVHHSLEFIDIFLQGDNLPGIIEQLMAIDVADQLLLQPLHISNQGLIHLLDPIKILFFSDGATFEKHLRLHFHSLPPLDLLLEDISLLNFAENVFQMRGLQIHLIMLPLQIVEVLFGIPADQIHSLVPTIVLPVQQIVDEIIRQDILADFLGGLDHLELTFEVLEVGDEVLPRFLLLVSVDLF